jgi:alpha/beta superfamily hydrolase
MLKLQQEPIYLDGPVGQLETLVIAPKDGAPRGIALIAHPNPLQGGTNTNKVVQTTARALSQHGYICYCPNLRGVGNSGGEHDYGQGEVDDAQAVVDYARAQHGDVPLVLAGFSFGSYVAAQLRQRIDARHLIMLGAAVSPKYAMPHVPADTIVIHGEHDEVISLAQVLDWARPQSLPVVVFPGVGHFFHGKLVLLQQYVQRLVPSL